MSNLKACACALPAAALIATLGPAAHGATPATMRAIVQQGNGGPEVLHLQMLPVREPGAGQVLIRVYAAGVNPIDWKMRRGGMGPPPGAAEPPPAAGGPPPGAGAPPPGAGAPPGAGPPSGMPMPGPRIPGLDVAGVVENLGPGVTAFKVGDPVFAMIGRSIDGLNGAYAEFALAPADNVVAKPRNFSFAEAAGIGTAGMTAAKIIGRAGVDKGQRVLITGVAGGVGSAAAQIARARGAHVIGTASGRHAAFLRSIGVDEVIDYTQAPFEEQVHDVDVVIDTVGGDTAQRALKTLRKGGSFATVAGRMATEQCTAAGVRCAEAGPPQPGESEGAMLRQVAALAAEGRFRVHVDKVYPLERAADAQEYNRDGHTEGKVILAVDARHAGAR